MAAVNNCRKFEANIFNKAKCQNCFKPKETHSAEALECSKQSRKISKCGYLFVAPESFDFANPLDKTRRWQRRFFVLYDDGELTYSVDENVNTVPQGVIDMSICTDVHDAENSTSHQYSVCVKVPDKVVYIKGTTKDEINRWFDVLVMYPRSIKTKKHRRTPTYHGLKDTERAKRQRYNSAHITSDEWDAEHEEDSLMYDDDDRPSRGLHRSRSDRGVNHSSSETPAIHYRGIRSLKHKHDKSYQEGLKKSNSLHDLSGPGDDGSSESWTSARERVRSKSGDRSSSAHHPYSAFRRRTDPHPIALPKQEEQQSSSRSISPPPAPSVSRPSAGLLRQTFGEQKTTALIQTLDDAVDDVEDDVGDEADSEDMENSNTGLDREIAESHQIPELYRSRSPTSSLLLNGRSKNETDERKMAKTMGRDHSSPRQSPARQDDNIHDDLKYMKKGWLLKQRHREGEWIKHWFVLSGATLCYFRDSRAEELNIMDGMIDLTHCRGVAELDTSRNYGFIVRTDDGDTLLSAMTSGIRTNWMQAIQKCIESKPTDRQPWAQPRISPNPRQVSMPERGITHPAFTQASQDGEHLAQSYPAAVRIKSQLNKETTRAKPIGQESKNNLDLNLSLGKDRPIINRRVTLDDYSSMSRRFNSEESLDRVGSQESLHSVTSEGSQGHSGQQPVKRRRRRDKQHKHRISCTWPHQSGDGLNADSAQGLAGDIRSQDSGSHSDLMEYIEEVDKDKRNRELSPDEHTQLDEVEKNIRKINRKSLTEYVLHHKPQHYDKFETGTAFAELGKDPSQKMSLSQRIMADYSREELQAMLQRSNTAPESTHIPSEGSSSTNSSSSSQLRSSPRSQPDGTSPRSLQQEHLIVTHGLMAHSATDAGRSTSSPEIRHKPEPVSTPTVSLPTSPPPAPITSPPISEGDLLEGLFPPEGFADGTMHEIIEQKWKESVEDTKANKCKNHTRKLESSGPALIKSPTSSMNGESTVVGLLEIEVETLKNKLEKTQRELVESQQLSAQLNNTLESTNSDSKVAVEDLEQDQSRYLNQMNEIQDQMEQSTEYFQSKLAELENRNQMTKLQLNSLRSQLQDAKSTIRTQQDEIVTLKSKLDQSNQEFSQTKSVFSDKMKEKEGEKQRLEKIIENLESRIHGLEADLQTQTVSLTKKDSELAQTKERVRVLVKETQEKSDRLESLEGEIQELLCLKQDEAERDHMLSALRQELDISKQQLRTQDEVMHQQERDYTAKIKAMEDEFYGEKDKLEMSIVQLKQRLGQVMHQSERTDAINSDMTDGMKERDQTIAQLEEKLIESDSKVEQLKIELSGIMREQSELQNSLEENISLKSKLESELEVTKKECARIKHQLSSVNTDIQDMKVKKDKLIEENQLLLQKVNSVESLGQGQTEEMSSLKTDLHKQTIELQETQEKYTQKCSECEELTTVVSDALLNTEWETTYTSKAEELHDATKKISQLEALVEDLQSKQASSSAREESGREGDLELGELVKEYSEEAQAWREKYEMQCEEIDRQMDEYSQAVERCEELEELVGSTEKELEVERKNVQRLEEAIEEQRVDFQKDLQHKYKEVSESEKALSDLHQQMVSTELQVKEQSAELDRLREREFLQQQQGGEREKSPRVGDEDVVQKYKDTLKDLKQTRKLLQETERKREELETANYAHKQKLQSVEMGYEDQVNQMREKVTELTNKLAASDRRLKRFNRRSSGPPEEELTAVDIQPDPELQARLVTMETSLSAAEKKVSELTAVKQELQITQAKAKDLSTQILDQRCLEIDMAALKTSELNLRDKNSQLSEEVDRLKQEISMLKELGEEKDQQDVIGRLLEVEGRFSKVQETLSDCQMKLLSLISELKTGGTCDYQSAGNTLEIVKSGIDRLLSFGAKSKMYSASRGAGFTSSEDIVRIYAEKLALEAIVLGELSYNMKVNEVDMALGYESVVYEMELAKHRLITLEETMNTLDSQFQWHVMSKGPQTIKATELLSVEHLSYLLSQKLKLQHQISEIVQKANPSEVPQTRLPQSKDTSIEEMGQETLFRIFMDDKLSESSQSSDLFPVKLFPQTVVHSDLSLIQSKIRSYCKASMSQKEKQSLVQNELVSSYQSLLSHHKHTTEVVSVFVNTCIDCLSTMCAADIMQLAAICNGGQISEELISRVFDKEQIQSEMTLMVNKYIHSHHSSNHTEGSYLSESLKERSGGLVDCVQKETSELCSKLISAIENKLQSGDIQCQVLPASERLRNLQQRNSIAMGLCNIVAQNALLRVQVLHVELVISQVKRGDKVPTSSDDRSELKLALKRNDSGVVVSSMSLPTSPVDQIHDKLLASIQQEAQCKSNLASYLLNNTANVRQPSTSSTSTSGNLKDQVAKLACELINIDSMMLRSNNQSVDYADYLCREAVMQAQMSYTTSLQKLLHHQELEQLRQELESSYKIQKSKQEVQLAELEDEIDRLTILIGEHEASGTGAAMAKTAAQYEEEIKEKNKKFEQDLEKQREEFERKIQSVVEELETSKEELHRSMQESSEHEQAKLDEAQQQLHKHQVTVERLESELSNYHQEKVRAEDMTSQKVESVQAENESLRQKLGAQADTHTVESAKLREKINWQKTIQVRLESKIQELELTIQNLQSDYEQELTSLRSDHRKELAQCKDEMLNQLAAVEAESMHIDENAIREKYMGEIDRIKSIYDNGFSSMEKSHQKVLMEMRKAHKKELDTLRQEKDQLLAEETWATQAALDAMRKAHEAELQKERNKFLDMLAKTYSHADVESLQTQHEENLNLIQSEIKQLSEQYSIKLLENASLEKKVEVQIKALHNSRRRVQELMMRNEELNSHLRHEIETLKNMVSPDTCPTSPVKKESDSPEIYQFKVALRVKDTEMLHMQDEVKQLKQQLENTSQELEDSVQKYHELYTEHQTTKKQHVVRVQSLEQALEQANSALTGHSDNTESPREGQEPSESSTRASLFTSAPDSIDNTSDSADSSAEKSPRLPRPREEVTSSPDRSSSSASSQLGAAGSGRQLPKVAPEARSMKRSLWRERQPERARSNPGPIPLNIPVFSLPPKQPSSRTKDQVSLSGSLDRSRKKRPSKMASVDIIEEL